MTKTKSTKRALLMSALALLMCVSMLIGSTFAWFTDSVTSGNNIIKSGNLDMKLSYKPYGAENTEWTEVTESSVLFGEDALYEPGYTEAIWLKVENLGSLAFRYDLAVNVASEKLGKTKDGADIKLSDYLEVKYMTTTSTDMESNFYTTRESLDSFAWGGAANSGVASLSDDIAVIKNGVAFSASDATNGAYSSAYVLIVISMPTTVGNEANHDGKNIPEIDFTLTAVATQLAYESDSFGSDYDKDATYPEINTVDTWDGTTDTSWYNETDTEFTLTTSEQLAGLADLVDDGNNFEGKTIKLGQDLDLASIQFNPIGHSANGKSFNGIFDGQGHTISNLYEQSNLDDKNGGWLYEGEYYGLFAYTQGATIKNVTVADAYISSGRNEAAGVVGNAVDTTFSDITISNTTLIAYNNSAGGVAAECYGNCSFTNITVDADTVIGPLWGTYDVRLGGVVGMVKSSDNVTFSNITVACQIDAINDVASNYQYWLYRYSGMLIGQVDGVNGVADPTGYVTCENVTVIYDDWVNYHYCEYADLGAGSYNGPGEYKYARVEAGTGTDGIDLSACNHNDDESHNVLIVFDQLFGGGQGVSGLKTYDGVTVIYPNN